ncbi:MAG: HigA family addiction module antidote protein [Parcubacteria group bacterium]|nr:HigA family addiction module antidote protein [Parcubacteria group bacterium]
MRNIKEKNIVRGWESPIFVHPGEFLEDELEENSISQIELAKRTGISKKIINDIVNGKNPITPNTAYKLSRVFGKSDDYWMNLQKTYNEDKCRILENKRIEKEVRKYIHNEDIKETYKELEKIGVLEKLSFIKINFRKIMLNMERFFAVYSLDFINRIKLDVAFRQYKRQKTNPYALAAWLRLGQIKASKTDVKKFNKQKLIRSLGIIKKLSTKESVDYFIELEKILAECGIVLVCAPKIKNTHAQGATQWINKDKVLIIIKTTNQGEDKFWFNLFHEIGHILKHGKKEILINMEDTMTNNKIEQEADHFAQKRLLPNFKQDFSDCSDKNDAIRLVAKKNNVSPSIVAGRLAHECGDNKKAWKITSRYIRRINYKNI